MLTRIEQPAWINEMTDKNAAVANGYKNEGSDLLTTKQAAKLLGIQPNTLAVWRVTKRHNIPYVKMGRLARYRLADILTFQAEHVA